jgi:hypothetical protein
MKTRERGEHFHPFLLSYGTPPFFLLPLPSFCQENRIRRKAEGGKGRVVERRWGQESLVFWFLFFLIAIFYSLARLPFLLSPKENR